MDELVTNVAMEYAVSLQLPIDRVYFGTAIYKRINLI